MNPQTVERNKSSGRILPIRCVREDALTDLEIKDSCFLLMVLYEGEAHFRLGDLSFDAIGPCFVCFDEKDSPQLIHKRGLKCDSIYFKPTFLNVNMTFPRIHSASYEHIATIHDMFLLKPFTDTGRYVFPVLEDVERLRSLFSCVERVLIEQSDWYWSCRSRSYFIEMMLLLERAYGLIDQKEDVGVSNMVRNPYLKNAVIYIETHYHETITLEHVAKSALLNRSTLTLLFKAELNMSPIEHVWHHRLAVAKKFLEFTELPVGEIAFRCGFKTPQHFSRKFEEKMGSTPTAFRTEVVANRKKSF